MRPGECRLIAEWQLGDMLEGLAHRGLLRGCSPLLTTDDHGRLFRSATPTLTGQNRRPPVSSLRYAALFVVPMNKHWRGSITSLRPCGGRYRSTVREMNDFKRAASARPMACISATSISHLPRRCCDASFPVLMSGSASE